MTSKAAQATMDFIKSIGLPELEKQAAVDHGWEMFEYGRQLGKEETIRLVLDKCKGDCQCK